MDEELKQLIFHGLNEIGYEIDYPEQERINLNLLIGIRQYLLQQNAEWYEKKFPAAYRFDLGETRCEGDPYYTDDGIRYHLNDKMELTDCELYGNGARCALDPPVRFLFHLSKRYRPSVYYSYSYINEIDHFFTYCINRYLNGEKGFSAREPGVRAIYDALTHSEQ